MLNTLGVIDHVMLLRDSAGWPIVAEMKELVDRICLAESQTQMSCFNVSPVKR